LYSERFLDHFQNPRNVGEVPSPAIVAEVANPACGDILRLSALVEESRIVEVRYKVRGCAASIAAGSSLTELLAGKTRGEAAGILAADVEDSVGGLIPESKHAAVLCVDAVKKLLAAWPR